MLAPTASAADTDSMRPMGTRVSGVLTGDLTWDVAGSPYWLEGGVRLSAGSRLRIEPGVQVMFNESGLNVEGDLEALGTPANPILFTRNGTSPLVVYVISSGGSMVFRNASFDFVTPGMGDVPGADFVLDNATLRLTVGPFINAARNVVITRSRIALTAASNGIAFSGSSSITISHNLITSWPGSPVGSGIQDSTGGGPFPMNRRVTIVGNVVEGSGFGLGIWVRSNGTLV
ncbi:MAG TPA: right-handed parallel beta-helix repeat-containing protein, partial [Thermoplasmata archaeon]|nr:right-handed parallel beta-helix repeat-containing protein [Thermoplasmata archaeon]